MSLSPAAEMPFFNFDPEPEQSVTDLLEHAANHLATEAHLFAPDDWTTAVAIVTPLTVEGQDEVDSVAVGWVTNGEVAMPLPVRRTTVPCLERFAVAFLSDPDAIEGVDEDRLTSVVVQIERGDADDKNELSVDAGVLSSDSIGVAYYPEVAANVLGITLGQPETQGDNA